MKHHQLTAAQACAFHQLTKVEIIVWCYCKAHDPFGANPIPGPTAIARATSLQKGNVCKALKSLEEKGWSVAAGQHSVAVEQPGVAVEQPGVAAGQPNVAVEQPNVAVRQLSNPETLLKTESQDSLDLKDLKLRDQEKRERTRPIAPEPIRPDDPTPVLTALAQVEAKTLDPQKGLVEPRARRSPRGGVTTVGEGTIPQGEYANVRDFVLAKVKRLPNPPQFPFKVAMDLIQRDPAAMWAEYQAAQLPPSQAQTILARAVGSAVEPWPEPETQAQSAPSPQDHAARLAAKWRAFPAHRKQITAECAHLGIPCTDLGPTVAIST
jgi:hypothetical protein